MKTIIMNRDVLEAMHVQGMRFNPDTRAVFESKEFPGFKVVTSQYMPDDTIIAFDPETVRKFNQENGI